MPTIIIPIGSVALLAALAQTPQPESPIPASPKPASPKAAAFEFRLASGAEWDTNALRAVDSDVFFLSVTRDVVGDGLMRLLVDTQGVFTPGQSHELRLGYVLGAKRFLMHATEDLLVHDLSLTISNMLSSWLALRTWGTLRASRIRSGLRDYSLIIGGASIGAHATNTLAIWLHGTATGFDFQPDTRLSYAGPSIGGEIAWRPYDRFTLSTRLDHHSRAYDGNALIQGTLTSTVGGTEPTVVGTFCDGSDVPTPPAMLACSPRRRDDREITFSVRALYHGPIVLGGEYLLRVQRSNSDLEGLDRHRVSAFLTTALPLDLKASLLAALEFKSGLSVTSAKNLVEDDENQNSVQAQLSRRLSEELIAEFRYALFTNAFATADATFLRQTLYLGLSFRLGS